MSTHVLLIVGLALLSTAAMLTPRAEARMSPASIEAAIGKAAVEQAAAVCTHRRVCRQGRGCAWRKVCKRR